MPADVSFQEIGQQGASLEAATPRRLPLGIGLTIAACASAGLWIAIAAGIHALIP